MTIATFNVVHCHCTLPFHTAPHREELWACPLCFLFHDAPASKHRARAIIHHQCAARNISRETKSLSKVQQHRGLGVRQTFLLFTCVTLLACFGQLLSLRKCRITCLIQTVQISPSANLDQSLHWLKPAPECLVVPGNPPLVYMHLNVCPHSDEASLIACLL